MFKYFAVLSVAMALAGPAGASDLKSRLADDIGVTRDAYTLGELLIITEVSGFERTRVKAAIDARNARLRNHLQTMLGANVVSVSTSN